MGKPCEFINECRRVPQLKDDHYCGTLLHSVIDSQASAHDKEGFSGGEFSLCFPTNTATISNVWCLEICAGTLFLMLLKFGAVLSIICGFLKAVLYLDPFTAVYCCCEVVSEDAKTTLASALQTLSLDRESNTVSLCVIPWIKPTPEYPFKAVVLPYLLLLGPSSSTRLLRSSACSLVLLCFLCSWFVPHGFRVSPQLLYFFFHPPLPTFFCQILWPAIL